MLNCPTSVNTGAGGSGTDADRRNPKHPLETRANERTMTARTGNYLVISPCVAATSKCDALASKRLKY